MIQNWAQVQVERSGYSFWVAIDTSHSYSLIEADNIRDDIFWVSLFVDVWGSVFCLIV